MTTRVTSSTPGAGSGAGTTFETEPGSDRHCSVSPVLLAGGANPLQGEQTRDTREEAVPSKQVRSAGRLGKKQSSRWFEFGGALARALRRAARLVLLLFIASTQSSCQADYATVYAKTDIPSWYYERVDDQARKRRRKRRRERTPRSDENLTSSNIVNKDIPIHIYRNNASPMTVEATLLDKVSELKTKVRDAFGLNENVVTLRFKQKTMNDRLSLFDYNLQPHAKLYLLVDTDDKPALLGGARNHDVDSRPDECIGLQRIVKAHLKVMKDIGKNSKDAADARKLKEQTEKALKENATLAESIKKEISTEEQDIREFCNVSGDNLFLKKYVPLMKAEYEQSLGDKKVELTRLDNERKVLLAKKEKYVSQEQHFIKKKKDNRAIVESIRKKLRTCAQEISLQMGTPLPKSTILRWIQEVWEKLVKGLNENSKDAADARKLKEQTEKALKENATLAESIKKEISTEEQDIREFCNVSGDNLFLKKYVPLMKAEYEQSLGDKKVELTRLDNERKVLLAKKEKYVSQEQHFIKKKKDNRAIVESIRKKLRTCAQEMSPKMGTQPPKSIPRKGKLAERIGQFYKTNLELGEDGTLRPSTSTYICQVVEVTPTSVTVSCQPNGKNKLETHTLDMQTFIQASEKHREDFKWISAPGNWPKRERKRRGSHVAGSGAVKRRKVSKTRFYNNPTECQAFRAKSGVETIPVRSGRNLSFVSDSNKSLNKHATELAGRDIHGDAVVYPAIRVGNEYQAQIPDVDRTTHAVADGTKTTNADAPVLLGKNIEASITEGTPGKARAANDENSELINTTSEYATQLVADDHSDVKPDMCEGTGILDFLPRDTEERKRPGSPVTGSCVLKRKKVTEDTPGKMSRPKRAATMSEPTKLACSQFLDRCYSVDVGGVTWYRIRVQPKNNDGQFASVRIGSNGYNLVFFAEILDWPRVMSISTFMEHVHGGKIDVWNF